jgi:hypothetical protein
MDKFKLVLVMLVIIVATVLTVTKLLILEAQDFWHFLQHRQ